MDKNSRYREVDVQALRAELSRRPKFFFFDDLVDVVVEMDANDFPPAITPDQIRQAVEEVRADCPYPAHSEPLYRSVHMAALDALKARLGLEERR